MAVLSADFNLIGEKVRILTLAEIREDIALSNPDFAGRTGSITGIFVEGGLSPEGYVIPPCYRFRPDNETTDYRLYEGEFEHLPQSCPAPTAV